MADDVVGQRNNILINLHFSAAFILNGPNDEAQYKQTVSLFYVLVTTNRLAVYAIAVNGKALVGFISA